MLQQTLFKLERKPPELSIAPLIDCIFLLLIFFMVTTTFTKETGVTVKKPVAKKADVMLDQNLLVAVTEQGEFWCEGEKVDEGGIYTKVKNRLKEYPETNVIILADKKSITQWVITALDTAKQAGAKKISIAEKLEVEAPAP
ncbi:MAG: biopolymer transporter ExbD [Candidatus Lernaella stagnicola]|nr:biopolymer transporter ExbD [Candidatus Lernaella stagnicola]